MTDRDDFSLPSTVGTSFASGAGGPVIKILLGGQVRRVPAHRLVKEGSNKPSYGTLRVLIAKYAFPDKKAPARDCEVTTTYVDEDGDAITISTDNELEDALTTVAAETGEGKKQVLRIDAVVKERDAEKKEEGRNDEKPKVEAALAETEAAKKEEHKLPERKLACGRVGKLQWDLLAVGEGELDAESKEAADRLVRDIVGSIALEKGEAAPDKAVAEEEKIGEEDKKEENADVNAPPVEDVPKAEPLVFIHARHTCDGCGVSPIMGVRYHATDRTDYDLCQGCFADPSVGCSDQKTFVTEELDRDRAMQSRWGRRFARGRLRCGRSSRRCHAGSLREHHRQVRRGRHCPVAPAQQRFADDLKQAVDQKQDDDDRELQEAVLRSMQEKKKATQTEEVKDNEKVEEKKDQEEAKEETESKATTSTEEDAAANWRSVADSFSSAAAGSGDFADVLGAVASVVATEFEKQADVMATEFVKQADVAADATRSAGDAAANSTRSAADAAVPNGIAAAISAAMKASKVASSVASEVKAVIDKELQKKQTEEESSAGAFGPSGDVKPGKKAVEDVPDIEGDEMKPAAVAEEASAPPPPAVGNQFLQWARGDAEGGGMFVDDKPAPEPTPAPASCRNETDNQFLQWARGDAIGGGTFDVTSAPGKKEQQPAAVAATPPPKSASPEQNQSKDDEAKGDNESEKSNTLVEPDGGETKDEDKPDEDNESEKSEWEDVGAEGDKVEVASDDGSASAAIAPPVLARWAEQLEVLRQLGFTNDRKSVDALETLQAANMGVDSTDEVTVGDAVNYLLKNAEE